METLFLVNLLEERDDSSAGDNSDLLFPLGGPWALAGTHPEPVGRGLGEGRGLGGGPAQVFVWGTRAARPGLQDPRDFRGGRGALGWYPVSLRALGFLCALAWIPTSPSLLWTAACAPGARGHCSCPGAAHAISSSPAGVSSAQDPRQGTELTISHPAGILGDGDSPTVTALNLLSLLPFLGTPGILRPVACLH